MFFGEQRKIMGLNYEILQWKYTPLHIFFAKVSLMQAKLNVVCLVAYMCFCFAKKTIAESLEILVHNL